jgi:putative oxidoreductase
MLMMSESQRTMLRTHGTLVGRILIGVLFLLAGYGKLTGDDGVSGFAQGLDGMGIPLSGLVAWVVIAIEIIGGAALILGYRVGLAAAALVVFILLTIVKVHNNLEDPMLFKNLAIMGGLLYVMAYGAGEGWRLGK